jgi:ubiquinone/menaquinone biosynthesis C-methylase UbiE
MPGLAFAGQRMNHHDITDFSIVDRTNDPGFYRCFLDAGNALPGSAASKRVILDGLRLSRGQRVLDVGCGLGDDVFAIAERVGPTGSVVGADVSEAMIEEAWRRAPAGAPVSFQVADARALPFPDGAFDGVRSERLLMHVPETQRALAEMARVTRRGGRMSVFDFDWDTMIVDSPQRDVTRAVVRSFSDHMKNGWIGRQLARLFREHGFVDVSVTTQMLFVPFPFFEMLVGGHLARMAESGALSRPALDAWSADLAAAHAEDRFLAGFAAFIVAGTRG